MLKRINERVELVANILIVTVALSLGAILVKQHFFTNPGLTGLNPTASKVLVGGKVKLPLSNIDWSKSEQTLVLVLREGCSFCFDSIPFYKKLVNETQGHQRVRLLVVMPTEVGIAQSYLKSVGLPMLEVKQATQQSLGVPGTPTLILVNNQGSIINAWVGKLDPKQELEVLAQLFSSEIRTDTSDNKMIHIDPQDAKNLVDSKGHSVILDIRDRVDYAQEHIKDSLNIPYDELEVRAINEISVSDFVIVYSTWADNVMPEDTYKMLRLAGYSHAAILTGGLEGWKQNELPVVNGQ
jgi:rhodanese-related sulfurtransferase/thiol-disulfide isomerase/thioredoxin